MNILVTGSTGFIGKNLVNYLLKKNHNLCLVSKKKKLKFIKKKKINVISLQCDINLNKKNLKKIINFSPDILVHLAWSGIPDYSKKNSKKNLLKQKKFFKKIFCVASIKKIIITGSCSEYKNQAYLTSNHFSNSKNKIKNFVKKKCQIKKISFIWARLFHVYGKYQNKRSLIPKIIDALKKKKEINIINGLAKHDYINVLDIVHFINLNLNLKYTNYECDLGSSFSYRVYDIYSFIKNNFLKLKTCKLKRFNNAFVAKKKNHKIFGWKPKIDIEVGLKQLLNSNAF
jgi:dTDP-6-deoxy-L-talose 4-dehydrogenase (NAD+)